MLKTTLDRRTTALSEINVSAASKQHLDRQRVQFGAIPALLFLSFTASERCTAPHPVSALPGEALATVLEAKWRPQQLLAAGRTGERLKSRDVADKEILNLILDSKKAQN